MNLQEVKNVITVDRSKNLHPKNIVFIYTYRLGNYFISKNSLLYKPAEIFFRIIAKFTYNKRNHIPMQTSIGAGTVFPHLLGIVISGNAVIGKNAVIMHQVTIGDNVVRNSHNSPVLGDNIFIGAGAKIIGNVKIGNNVIIGANAVITKNIPDNKVVVGANIILEK